MKKTYEVTLWRYPSELREENSVSNSKHENGNVSYFTEEADSKDEAIRKAKAKFPYSVYESLAIEQ